MRKSFAVAVGVILVGCGGGAEENAAPKAPTTPSVATTTPQPPTTAEAPKQEPKQAALSPAEAAKKTLQDFAFAMEAHDAKKVASLYTENAVIKHAGMPDLSGRDAIEGMYKMMFDRIPTAKGMSTRIWMKGDVAINEWAMAGTHTAELMGVKPTEKPIGNTGVDVVWFTPEGLIKEDHSYSDAGTMMAQIGASKQKGRPVPTIEKKAPQFFVATGSPEEQKNVDAATKMMGAFEKKSAADFTAGAANDIAWDDMTQPETSKGKDAATKYFNMMTKAFPDVKVTSQNVWAVGDFVIAEGTMTGTHNGALGPIQPTKKTINLHGLDIIQFKDGKVVHGWSYANGLEMLVQLGQIPQPGAPKADTAKKDDAQKDDAKKPVPAKKDDAKK